jgi:N-acetylglucosamine kinase-like BadF-type ATPase
VTSPLYVGVDGGATRCRAMVLDHDGRQVGRAEGPAGIVTVRTATAAAAIVAAVVRDAVRDAGRHDPGDAGTSPPVARLVAGLAGAGRPDARDAARSALEATGIATAVEVLGDSEIALDDAFDDGAGILIVAGTGSMALGRQAPGREARGHEDQGHEARARQARAGGWGVVLGDEGSGWWLGIGGLRAVARAADGRGPATILTRVLLDALALPDPAAMISRVGAASKGEIAALAPLVLRAALDGDAVSRQLADDAAGELAAAAAAVRRALDPWPEPPTVVGVGGLIAPDGLLRDRVAEALGRHELVFDPREVVPARGAARRAWRGG